MLISQIILYISIQFGTIANATIFQNPLLTLTIARAIIYTICYASANETNLAYVGGKMSGKQTKFKYRDVFWLVLDNQKFKDSLQDLNTPFIEKDNDFYTCHPVIINSKGTKLKNILTGDIISGYNKDFSFYNGFLSEKQIKNIKITVPEKRTDKSYEFSYEFFNSDHFEIKSVGHYKNEIRFFDTIKSRIAKDLIVYGENEIEDFEYSASDFAKFKPVATKIISKELTSNYFNSEFNYEKKYKDNFKF